MYIIYITIPIVIHTRLSIQFSLVYPHIGRKILMFKINSFIHHIYNNIWFARIDFPRGFQINVGTCITTFLTGIMIMPLKTIVWIIHCRSSRRPVV